MCVCVFRARVLLGPFVLGFENQLLCCMRNAAVCYCWPGACGSVSARPSHRLMSLARHRAQRRPRGRRAVRGAQEEEAAEKWGPEKGGRKIELNPARFIEKELPAQKERDEARIFIPKCLCVHVFISLSICSHTIAPPQCHSGASSPLPCMAPQLHLGARQPPNASQECSCTMGDGLFASISRRKLAPKQGDEQQQQEEEGPRAAPKLRSVGAQRGESSAGSDCATGSQNTRSSNGHNVLFVRLKRDKE